MRYYPEPDGHISNKVKVALNLSNYDFIKNKMLQVLIHLILMLKVISLL